MEKDSIILDLPFRSGVTGKYKLKVKEVTPTYSDYQYILIDGEEKEYSSASKVRYGINDILRCIVGFKVENARFVVTETSICKKQDFASPLPDTERPKIKSTPVVKSKKTEKAKPGINYSKLGDPYKSGTSGIYKMHIVSRTKSGKSYSYILEDAQGRRYDCESTSGYAENSIIPCYVEVVRTKGSIQANITSLGKTKKAKAKRKTKKKYHGSSGRNQRDWLGTQYVGVGFHVIYTPMGNKR